MKQSAINFESVKSPENEKIARWLRLKRKSKGHTMRSLAELIGTQHSFVGKVEKQQRRLDIVEFVKYCQKLGIDPVEGVNMIQESLI